VQVAKLVNDDSSDVSGFALYSSFDHFNVARASQGQETMAFFLSLERTPGAGVASQAEGCVWAVMHRKGLPGGRFALARLRAKGLYELHATKGSLAVSGPRLWRSAPDLGGASRQ
jgi:hypothetical protein